MIRGNFTMKKLCLEPVYSKQPPDGMAWTAYAVNDVFETSLVLTTASAASLVLHPDMPIHFTSQEKDISQLHPWLKPGAELVPERGYMLDLQRSCIILMRKREYGLNQRLILLGLFLEDAADYVATKRGYQLGHLIQSYESPVFKARFHEAAQAIQFAPLSYLTYLWKQIVQLDHRDLLRDDEAKTNYLSLLQHLFGLGQPQVDTAAMERSYRDGHAAYHTFLVDRWPYVMENYLIYSFFERFYPCSLEGGIVHNYWAFMTIYKLAELILLTLSAARRDDLQLEDVYEVVAHMERLQLNPQFHATVERYIQDKEDKSLELFNALYDLNQ